MNWYGVIFKGKKVIAVKESRYIPSLSDFGMRDFKGNDKYKISEVKIVVQ